MGRDLSKFAKGNGHAYDVKTITIWMGVERWVWEAVCFFACGYLDTSVKLCVDFSRHRR